MIAAMKSKIVTRGGRLIKWKGEVASCAPSAFGVPVSPANARSGSVSALALIAGAVLVPLGIVVTTPAWAANECTSNLPPGPDAIINCNPGTYNAVNGDIVYTNLVGPTVNVTGGITVTTASIAINVGALVASAGPATVVINNAGGVIGNQVAVIHAGTGGASLTLTDGTITTPVPGGIALSATSTGVGAATIWVRGGSIQTSDVGAIGAQALSAGSAVVTIDGGSIAVTGVGARGVEANITNVDSTSPAQVIMNAGAVSTAGSDATGLRALTTGTGGTVITMNGGTVNLTGAGQSWGLESTSTGGVGDTLITVNGGTITTRVNATRSWQRGLTGSAINVISGGTLTSSERQTVESRNENGSGDAIVVMNGGTLNATVDYGIVSWNRAGVGVSSVLIEAGATINGLGGAYSYASNFGERTVTMTGGTINIVGGGVDGGVGLLGFTDNAANVANTTITMTGGSINGVGGDRTSGMIAASALGDSIVRFDGGIITAGSDGLGIAAYTAEGSEGSYEISVTGGSVSGGSGNGAAIQGVADVGTITIGAAAVIDGSASDVAILDGYELRDGVDLRAGEATVTSAGTVTGNAILGLGDDSLTLTGGTYTGTIFGDGAIADANDGDDSFSWTGGALFGGFNGQNGSDIAQVTAAGYNGSQVFDGGDDVSALDGWVDVLSLNGVSGVTTGANLTNWERILLNNTSLTFTDAALITGSEVLLGIDLAGASTVNTGANFALTGNIGIGAGSAFNGIGAGSGTYSFSNEVTNNGTISVQDGGAGDTITVGGNYSGTGLLLIDTFLGAAGSASDTMVVRGDVLAGTRTGIVVGNTALPGDAALVTSGILIVDVVGNTVDDGVAFRLAGTNLVTIGGTDSVINGAYAYFLRQGVDIVTPTPGQGSAAESWYLVSQLSGLPEGPVFSPSTPVYEAYPLALLGLQTMPSLQQRVGNRHWASAAAPAAPVYVFCKDPAQNFRCLVTGEQALSYADGAGGTVTIEGGGAWVRVDGSRSKIVPVISTSGIETDQSVGGLEAGIDRLLSENADGDRLIGGVSLRYAQSGTDVTSVFGNGAIDTKGFGLGASLTWYDTDGLYVDAQARVMWSQSDLSSTVLGSLAENVDGFGYGLSLEVGKEIALKNNWNVTPQAQLSYGNVKSDDFVGPFAIITDVKGESLGLRLGVVLSNEVKWQAEDGTTSRRAVNVGAHVIKDFSPKSSVVVSGATLTTEREDLTGEITLGGTYNWSDDKYSVYGQVAASTGLDNFGDSHRLGATAGMRIQWE